MMEDHDTLSEYKFEVSIPRMSNWPGGNFALNVVHLVLRIPDGEPKPPFFARPPPSAGIIEIRVKNMRGETRTLRVMSSYHVEELKAIINEDTFTLPLDDMTLQHLGRTLQDGHTLDEYKISNNDTIHVNLPAGHRRRWQRRMTNENYKALVLARRLSRSVMRETIPRDEFPTALSLVSGDLSATFALIHSNPAMLVSGNFSGDESGRLGEDILNLVTNEHKFEATRLAQELKHNESLEELLDKLATSLVELGLNEEDTCNEVAMAMRIKLQISTENRRRADETP